jgi:sigma-B regulation protein RsbU (phosphoserine phosphatase)
MLTSPGIAGGEQPVLAHLDQHQVRDFLKLQRAAQKITSILDLDQLIDKIVHDVAGSFGCLEANIYLHDEDRGEMFIAGVCGCTVNHKGHSLKIGKEGMVGYVASTGQMRYAPDVSQDPYFIACEPSIRSEVAIPLLVDNRLVGVFTTSHPELDAFPPEQLRLLQSLCGHVAVAVQNARLFQKERRQREIMDREAEEAREIQQSLFPRSSPFIPGMVVSGVSVPAGAVGGDWYDFISLEDGRWALVLADVSGKGTAAALLMSATRGMVRSLATCCGPASVLTKLNRLLVEDFPCGRFVTMIYAVLDPANRALTFASAGHLPPLLIDPAGARYVETEKGMPLGLSYGEYSEQTIDLPPDSRVLFYSDGITEASNSSDEEFGVDRLRDAAQHVAACPEVLIETVRTFAKGAGLQDDATAILIKA